LAGKRFDTARHILGKSYEALVDDPRWVESIGIFDTKTVRGWVKTGIPQNRVAQLAGYIRIPAYMLVDYALSDQVFERHVYEVIADKGLPGTDPPAVPNDTQGHHFDAFICHAKEDTLIAVRPLFDALAKAGLKARYEGYALRKGDDLIRTVSRGLSISRAGILICSEAFFQYDWPAAELDEIADIEINGRKPIVGIGYGVDRGFVARYSEKLAGRIVADTPSVFKHLAIQLSDFLHPEEEKSKKDPALKFENLLAHR